MIWTTFLDKCLSTKHDSLIRCLEIKVRIGAIRWIVWISPEVEWRLVIQLITIIAIIWKQMKGIKHLDFYIVWDLRSLTKQMC